MTNVYRVKSVFNAPVPEYCIDIASALSAHSPFRISINSINTTRYSDKNDNGLFIYTFECSKVGALLVWFEIAQRLQLRVETVLRKHRLHKNQTVQSKRKKKKQSSFIYFTWTTFVRSKLSMLKKTSIKYYFSIIKNRTNSLEQHQSKRYKKT